MGSTVTAQVRAAPSTETRGGADLPSSHVPLVPSLLGYDDLTQGTAAGDYSKGGYGGSSQAQNKSAGSGPGKGSVFPSFPGLRPRVVVSSLTPAQARRAQSALEVGEAGAAPPVVATTAFSSRSVCVVKHHGPT